MRDRPGGGVVTMDTDTPVQDDVVGLTDFLVALDGDDPRRAALILRFLWLEADQARTLKNTEKCRPDSLTVTDHALRQHNHLLVL